jgi:hypothetical protein
VYRSCFWKDVSCTFKIFTTGGYLFWRSKQTRTSPCKLIAPLSVFRNVINLMRRVRASDYATRGWLGGAAGDETSQLLLLFALSVSNKFETTRVGPRSLWSLWISLWCSFVVRRATCVLLRWCTCRPGKEGQCRRRRFLPLLTYAVSVLRCFVSVCRSQQCLQCHCQVCWVKLMASC